MSAKFHAFGNISRLSVTFYARCDVIRLKNTRRLLIAAVKHVIDLPTFNSKFARNATFSRITHQHVLTVRRLAKK